MMPLQRTATDTLTAVELDRRDTLRFTRADGRVIPITLHGTRAELIRTDLPALKVEQQGAITALRFFMDLEIDGERHELSRELSTQKSFYEPYVIAGLRLWPDAVDDVFEFLVEAHGECRPRKHARLALQDATLRICPEPLHPWCPLAEEGLDVRECYFGDDTWLGGYFGASAHGGLDINHPRGTPIWAPIDFDDHWLFNTQAEHKNNRWRGVRTWPDGSTWTLQCHHLTRLLVPERTPLRAGTHYAEGAGVYVGEHDHSHFVFKVRHPGQDEVLLDPWVLFWQMYQDRAAFASCFYQRAGRGLYRGKFDHA